MARVSAGLDLGWRYVESRGSDPPAVAGLSFEVFHVCSYKFIVSP